MSHNPVSRLLSESRLTPSITYAPPKKHKRHAEGGSGLNELFGSHLHLKRARLRLPTPAYKPANPHHHHSSHKMHCDTEPVRRHIEPEAIP